MIFIYVYKFHRYICYSLKYPYLDIIKTILNKSFSPILKWGIRFLQYVVRKMTKQLKNNGSYENTAELLADDCFKIPIYSSVMTNV